MAAEADLGPIIDMMKRHGIAEFEYEHDGRHVLLKQGERNGPSRFEASPPPSRRSAEHILRAPYPGSFEPFSSEPGTLPTATRAVRGGEIVGFLSIGPLRRPVLAATDGVITRVLADPGTTVGYGSPLFAMLVARSTDPTD